MNDAMIELTGLTKTYDQGTEKVHALVDLDLGIARGESLAILGPSGSGKSTLLQLMGLLDTATRGTYHLGGRNITSLTAPELARCRNEQIGFVFQRFHLVGRLSALDNVELPLRFGSTPRKERRRRAATLLERVGLGNRADHRPSELSGGQQQRVAIARAMAANPDVLLADESTGALDQAMGAEILALLQELNSEGKTLVVVTHDEDLASKLPRAVRMVDGRVVQDLKTITS